MIFKEGFSENVSGADIHYLTEGIVHIHYPEGTSYVLEDAKNMFKSISTKVNLKKYRLLISGGDFVTIDKDAQKFNASDEVSKRCAAIALISENLARRLIGNFFIKVLKPSAIVKMFEKEEDALIWLRQFSNEEF